MGDFIVASLIIIIVGLAIFKTVIDRKSGVVCSSCPHAKRNTSNCQSGK